ncbi:hypothetical protein GEMRC1_011551 [Eukaryota sp. GEM-RC1]
MPVQLKVIGKVITVAAGWSHCVAVDVSNDVWSWGQNLDGSLGRVVSPSFPANIPGIITGLTGEGVTGVTIYARSNIAFSSAPFDAIRSSSKDGIITLQDTNQITGSVNCSGIQQFNLIYLPVYLSGTLNGLLIVDSSGEPYLNYLVLGASECSTLTLDSDCFVDTLYWYCGTIEGVGELKVNTLVFCSSNPELTLSKISIGKMMTSELSVELNLNYDLCLSIDGIIEIPQLSFYSTLPITLIFDGNFKLLNTSLSLHVDSHLKSNIEIDCNSQLQILSSTSTLGVDFSLIMYYDWSTNPTEHDFSGNNNSILNLSGADWNTNGYYQFESSTDVLKIPKIGNKFGQEPLTLAFSIWFDSDSTNRFGFSTNPSGCVLVIGDQLSFGDKTIEDLLIPRNQWISLIVTTDHSGAQMYINGALMASVNGNYDCDEFADFFPL